MRKSKNEIIVELGESFNSLCLAGMSVGDANFNISKENKWSAAENIQHLVNATRMTSLAFTLPKIFHVLLYGKPKRTSHGYNKIVENYQKKLSEGAQASGLYIPKRGNYEKEVLTGKLKTEGEKLVKAASEKWSDEQMDQYQISHPILGLLTIRELAYFTIHHNGHHLQTIRKHYLV
jgi:hypothetical protein